LKSLVSIHGTSKWSTVAEALGGRSGKQVSGENSTGLYLSFAGGKLQQKSLNPAPTDTKFINDKTSPRFFTSRLVTSRHVTSLHVTSLILINTKKKQNKTRSAERDGITTSTLTSRKVTGQKRRTGS